MVTRFEERTKAKSDEAENWRPQATDFMAKPKADKKFEHLRSIMAEGNQHVEIISRLRFQMQDYVPGIRNSVHLEPSEIKKMCNRLLEAISKIGKLEKGITDELDILNEAFRPMERSMKPCILELSLKPVPMLSRFIITFE